MNIHIRDGLPFVSVSIVYQQKQLTLEDVLLDTGSAGTIFAVDKLAAINLFMEPHDTIRRIRGVGGAEFVFSKRVERLVMGGLQANDFEIEVGAMEYGFAMDGIVGMDFLLHVGAVLDLKRLVVEEGEEDELQ